MPLLHQHQLFVERYVACSNLVEAYQYAYPGRSSEVARVSALRLLRRPDVQEAIAQLQGLPLRERTLEQIADKAAVGPADVIRELVCVAFADATEVFDEPRAGSPGELRLRHPREIPIDVRRAIQSIKVQRTRTRTTTRLISQAGQPASVEHQETVAVVEYKLHSKLEALKAIGQYLGLFQELPPVKVLLAHAAAEHGQAAADLLRQALAGAAARARGRAKLASDPPVSPPTPGHGAPPPAGAAAAQPASIKGAGPAPGQAAGPVRVPQQAGGDPGRTSGPLPAFHAAPATAAEVADQDSVPPSRRPTEERDVVGMRPRPGHVPHHGVSVDLD
jgi:phage terminase small subunit